MNKIRLKPKCGMHNRVLTFVRMLAWNGGPCKGKFWGHLVPEAERNGMNEQRNGGFFRKERGS